MSIWSNVWGSIVGGWRTHGINLGGDDGAFAGSSNYSESVTAESALKLSAVWACVGLRASTIASLPVHLRKDREIANEHPLYRILHDSPNADMTASEFWEMQVVMLDLQGNGYSRIDRIGGRVTSLNPLGPDVKVERRPNGSLWYKTHKDEYPESEILHLKGFTLDGLQGLSVLEFGREILGSQLAADTAARRTFEQGVKVGGFMKTGATTLTPDQRDKFRRNMGELAKAENAGKWMLLEAGWEPTFSQLLKPLDSELLASRGFGIEEVCRLFRVPPQLIGHTDKASSWASSLENTNLGFLTYSLRPTLVRIEQAIVKKLLAPEERGTYRPKFSVEGLLRADSAARASFYSTMLQNGVFSRNHVRGLEDLPPVEGGDVLTVQLNLTTLDQAGKQPEPPAPPPEPAPVKSEPINVTVNVADRKAQGFTITRDA